MPLMPATAVRVFSRSLTDGAHYRRFAVERSSTLGWSVREEADATIVRQATYDDWHGIELAIRGFALEAAALTRLGWHDN
jgi:hypothetical protein